MAIFIPSIKPDDFNNSLGEKKVYDALRSLNDKYTIYYSLRWVGVNEKRTVGEADFVILHPDKGLLVIEVKSGEIEYKNGDWIQTNTLTRVSKRINPLNQARKSQFELMDRLYAADLNFPIPMMCYCAWFPSVEMPSEGALPPEASKEIILDQKSLENPEKAINICFSYWERKYRSIHLDQVQYHKIVDILCPYFHVIPKLKNKIEETEIFYIQLTNQQSALLDFLNEQRTAVIHGLAGTGKTVLALEKAKRLAADKEPVLFLCYNSFLKNMLKQNNSVPNVIFHNAHSLAFEILGKSNDSINLEEFEDYLELVFDADNWKYGNIIVDEGQDLDDRLLNRLFELVKMKKGCFYVFYDRNQYIMKNKLPSWIENAECKLVLYKNCRNTAEIFKTSCSILGLNNHISNDIHGDIPSISFYKTESQLEAIVECFINKYISEGLETNDIVILTARTYESSWISTDKEYAGMRISQSNEPGKILFTSIRKFKGLEAEAVLIIDSSISSLVDEENKRLLYVGSSRAKNILKIAMREDIDGNDLGDFLRSMAPGRNVPQNKKGLKRLLNVTVQ